MVVIDSDWIRKVTYSAEDDLVFNSARILLLFQELSKQSDKGIDVERLTYYDFFSANPFVILSEDEASARLDFELEGFVPNKLEYSSSAQRYSSKRESMKHYLAMLLCRGLICVSNEDAKIKFKITEKGLSIADQIHTMYALAYRKSVRYVIKRLKDYSDTRLWESSRKWLEAKAFQIDLYDFREADNE
jgi:hypothetical protein